MTIWALLCGSWTGVLVKDLMRQHPGWDQVLGFFGEMYERGYRNLTLIGGESLGIFLSLGVKAKMGSASNLHNCIKLLVIIEFKESSNTVPNVLFRYI